VILIDSPPSLGSDAEHTGGVGCRDYSDADRIYALEGISQLLKTIDLVKRHLNPSLAIASVILTMFDNRTRLAIRW